METERGNGTQDSWTDVHCPTCSAFVAKFDIAEGRGYVRCRSCPTWFIVDIRNGIVNSTTRVEKKGKQMTA